MTQQARIDKGLYWDRAWSLVSGCTQISPGCLNCWSAQQAHIRGAQGNEKIKARYGGLTNSDGSWTGEIRLMADDLGKPGSVRKPATWAVWNDLFHPDVPFEFVHQAFAVMWINSHHTFLILTKRPKRMADFFAYLHRQMEQEYGRILYEQWPLPNIWLGVTAENQAAADERIPILLQTPAAVRYVSVEPMLTEVDLTMYAFDSFQDRPLDWVICGAETGPRKRAMELDWARELRHTCQASGTQFFFKKDSNGNRELDGRLWEQMLQ